MQSEPNPYHDPSPDRTTRNPPPSKVNTVILTCPDYRCVNLGFRNYYELKGHPGQYQSVVTCHSGWLTCINFCSDELLRVLVRMYSAVTAKFANRSTTTIVTDWLLLLPLYNSSDLVRHDTSTRSALRTERAFNNSNDADASPASYDSSLLQLNPSGRRKTRT